ncbi:MAG TPA: hypothetical protein VML95_02155 [Longimicrobiales bacterium]|nr:hypothetical protein [Longimicrobiales bacterium]
MSAERGSTTLCPDGRRRARPIVRSFRVNPVEDALIEAGRLAAGQELAAFIREAVVAAAHERATAAAAGQ